MGDENLEKGYSELSDLLSKLIHPFEGNRFRFSLSFPFKLFLRANFLPHENSGLHILIRLTSEHSENCVKLEVTMCIPDIEDSVKAT